MIGILYFIGFMMIGVVSTILVHNSIVDAELVEYRINN